PELLQPTAGFGRFGDQLLASRVVGHNADRILGIVQSPQQFGLLFYFGRRNDWWGRKEEDSNLIAQEARSCLFSRQERLFDPRRVKIQTRLHELPVDFAVYFNLPCSGLLGQRCRVASIRGVYRIGEDGERLMPLSPL